MRRSRFAVHDSHVPVQKPLLPVLAAPVPARKRRLTALAALIAAALLLPSPTAAQSGFFLRLAPEASRVTVEHTKKVTIGGGSSTSTSAHSGATLAARMSLGFRSQRPGNWWFGGETEVVVSAQRLIEGTIHPTPNGNPHDVWPGRWEVSDRFALGANLQLGRGIGDGGAQAFLLAGTRRMSSEFATGGTNPETGVAGEDRERLAHWPVVLGVGATLPARWPADVRLQYFRSITGWVISAPDVRLDYDYVISGFGLSVGIGLG